MIKFPAAAGLATLYTVATTLAIAPMSLAAPQSWLDQPPRNWNPNLSGDNTASLYWPTGTTDGNVVFADP
ncbi:MAG: hypothetical protein ACK4K5_10570 [Thermosynechococcus sp.]|uniref:hypothetical protein n=1 Tax=Thermosynechococcus sp. TaxID=2814275 RepID=UPI00391CBC7B